VEVLFTWQGRVSRLPYFLAAILVAGVKYAIDGLVAAHFGVKWQLWATSMIPCRRSSLSLAGGTNSGCI
jgi:hypothetical protein